MERLSHGLCWPSISRRLRRRLRPFLNSTTLSSVLPLSMASVISPASVSFILCFIRVHNLLINVSAPRIVVGATYTELKEEMKLLWGKDLKINTVHVDDVVLAFVAIARMAISGDKGKVLGEVFNLADKGETDQETVNSFLRGMFGIQTGFIGSMMSNMAHVCFNFLLLMFCLNIQF